MRLNLSPNPSFEAGTSGWSAAAIPKVVTAGATLARVQQSGDFGSFVGRVTSTAAPAGQGVAHTVSDFVRGGDEYTASLTLGGTIPDGGLRVVLRDSTGKQEMALVETPSRVSVTLATDPAALSLVLSVVTASPAAATWWVDGVLVEQGGTAGAYFDGDTTGAGLHTWRGAAGASVSAEWDPAVAVRLRSTPAPSARVTVTDLPGAVVSRIRVWRGVGSYEDRVPGDEDQIPSGAVLLDDYRVPLGRPVTYRVEVLSSAGVLVAELQSSPVEAEPPADCSLVWVMDPDDPKRAMLVRAMAGTDETTTWSSEGSAQSVTLGKPYWLADHREVAERTLVLRTDTWEDAARFSEMLRPGGEILVRAGLRTFRHDTGLLYIGAARVEEMPYRPFTGKTRWRIEGIETRGDAWPLVVVERTWADVKAEAATWADVLSGRRTWLAVKAG